MRKFEKHILMKAVILNIILIFSLTVPAFAAQFRDISDDSVFYPAVTYLQAKGIMNGYADGQFHPLGKMTGNTFSITVYRAIFPGKDLPKSTPEKTQAQACMEYLLEQKVITSPEFEMLSTGSITWQVCWRVLLPQFGIYPYPCSLYTEYSDIYKVDDSYMDAQIAAIETGLADTTIVCNSRPTRGNFAVFLYRLMTKDFIPLEERGTENLPDSVKQFSSENWLGRNAIIQAYPNIPKRLINHFLADGWEIRYDDISAVCPDYSYATGLTCYDSKCIYIDDCGESGVYHEFGHYLSYLMDLDAKEAVCFQEEGEKAHSLLGDYAMTNSSEYFAEAFAFWIDPDNDRNLLKQVAPKTAALIEPYTI